MQPGRVRAVAQRAADRAAAARRSAFTIWARTFARRVPDAVTLPQYFKQHGYRTEGMGKIFHVGHGNHEDPASWSVPHWQAKSLRYALPESRAIEGITREEALFSNSDRRRPRNCRRAPPTNPPTCRTTPIPTARSPTKPSSGSQAAKNTERAVLPRRRFPEAAPAVLRAEEVLGPVRSGDLQACRTARRRPRARRHTRRQSGASCGKYAGHAGEGPGARRRCAHAHPRLSRRRQLHGRAARPRAR